MQRNTVSAWDPVAGEAVAVPDHWADREPDMDRETARRLALRGDLSDGDLPVLLGSDMSADPVEGVQGSFTAVEDGECPECPSEYVVRSTVTLAGVTSKHCLLCDYEIQAP